MEIKMKLLSTMNCLNNEIDEEKNKCLHVYKIDL